MVINSIKNARDLSGKKVILRADFNVPVKKRLVTDDFKIQAVLPTVKWLMKNEAKTIIITHYGRPKGGDKKYSTAILAEHLSHLLKKPVTHVTETVGLKASTAVSRLKNGGVIILENLRFHPGEEKNSSAFAGELAGLGDLYVNDAFSVCHRNHASVNAITARLPSYAGLLLEQELENLNKVLKPARPCVAILGGAKLETKLPVLKSMLKIADQILVGGKLGNILLLAGGFCPEWAAPVEANDLRIAKSLRNKKIILPVDAVVLDEKNRVTARVCVKIKKPDRAFDIGPKTIYLYSHLIKKAKTIIWNGPMGKFEDDHFKHGTLAIARLVAARSRGQAFGVAGGGETIEALRRTKMEQFVDWISTGGGAMLAYLAGEAMPGLERITKQK